jgi:hypothetical protein
MTTTSFGPATDIDITRMLRPQRPGEVDELRYWVGAGLTAAVTALIGVVGMVVAHGIVKVPVLLGSGHDLSAVHAAAYGMTIVAIAIGAAALFDAMLRIAPRPATYYRALMAMLTALATLLPFTTTTGLHSQIAFGAMNLAVGIALIVLVPLAAVNARR